MRFYTLNCAGVNSAALEWFTETIRNLSYFAAKRFVEIQAEEKLSEKEFVKKYFSPEGEQFITRLTAPARRMQDTLFSNEQDFALNWYENFDMEGNAKAIKKEFKKKFGDVAMPEKPEENEIVQGIMRYDWIMNRVIYDFCKLNEWENLPDEYYDVEHLTDVAKVKGILSFKTDIFALQEVSEELYELIKNGMGPLYSISDYGQSVIIWRNESFPGFKKRECADVNGQTVCYENDSHIVLNTHLTSKAPGKANVNYETQAEELKEVMKILADTGKEVFVAGDFNHHFMCAGWDCATDILGTDNKMRSWIQAQYNKAMKPSKAIKDCILYRGKGTLSAGKTFLLDKEEVTADYRPSIPNIYHGADHYLIFAESD